MQPAIIVSTPASFDRMISELKGSSAFGIDTESNSLHAYREQVCLIQISTRENDYLIDPFPLGGMEGLGLIFADPAIQKVFHAGDYDITCLKREYGFSFANLFDTMLASMTLGETAIGLAAVLKNHLGVMLDKKYQRADWGKRPIKPEMLLYAQNDSHYLLELRDKLVPLLIEKDRLGLLSEDCRDLTRLEPAVYDPVQAFWHIHGAQTLKPQQLSLLKALAEARKNLAEKYDRPVFKILSDVSLVDLAKVQPHHIQELDLLPTFTANQVKAYGKPIMAAIAEWRRKPEPVEKRIIKKINEAELHRRDRLSNWRKETGLALGVSSNVILSKELIEEISRRHLGSIEDLHKIMAEHPHRYNLFGKAIFEALQEEKL